MSGWGRWKYALLGVLVAGQATAAGLSILLPDGFRPDGSLSSLLPAPASMPAPEQEPTDLGVLSVRSAQAAKHQLDSCEGNESEV